MQFTAFWKAKDGLSRLIRSLGILAFVVIGPRRGPTMLNRMWSEAELAVYMLQITSSSKRANSCLLFAPFGDGWGGFDLPQVPFPSVTTHAVKHSSPPSGTGLAPIRYTSKLRMNCQSQKPQQQNKNKGRLRCMESPSILKARQRRISMLRSSKRRKSAMC